MVERTSASVVEPDQENHQSSPENSESRNGFTGARNDQQDIIEDGLREESPMIQFVLPETSPASVKLREPSCGKWTAVTEKSTPNSIQAYENARALHEAQEFEVALEDWQSFLKQYSTDPLVLQAHLLLAQAQEKMGEPAKGLATLKSLLAHYELNESTEKACFALFHSCIDTIEPEKREKEFSALLSHESKSVQEEAAYGLHVLASEKFEKKEFAEAAQLVELIVKRGSAYSGIERVRKFHEIVLNKVGWEHYRGDELYRALDLFKQQLKAYPAGEKSIDARFMKAHLEFRLERFEEAAATYSEVQSELKGMGERSELWEERLSRAITEGDEAMSRARRGTDERALADIEEMLSRGKYEETLENAAVLVARREELDVDIAFKAKLCIGLASKGLGKSDDAIKAFDELISSQAPEGVLFRKVQDIRVHARVEKGELLEESDLEKAPVEYLRVLYHRDILSAEPGSDLLHHQARAARRLAELCPDKSSRYLQALREKLNEVLESAPNSEAAAVARKLLADC